jgi:hypothetical protein
MKPHAAGLLSTCSLALLCLSTAVVAADPQSTATKTQRQATTVHSAAAVKTFDTPQQAANALIKAADQFDVGTLQELFGANHDVVLSGEYASDRQRAKEFVALAREKNNVSIDPKNGSRAFVLVGNDNWPFPVPIVKRGQQWSFDAAAGRQELLYRRIGANERDAIAISRGYVEAQHEYAFKKREGYEIAVAK